MVAEYEEPEPWLDRNGAALKENPPDFVLVASDSRMLKLASPLDDDAAAEQMIDAAIARISRIAEVAGRATARPVILQTLADDPDATRFNMDMGLPGTPRFLTSEFNRRLARQARHDSRLVLDVNALASLVGLSAWSAGRYWYAAKYPFATAMIPLYADNIMRILAAQMGRSRRVLVLDLDNTMWGGIVGDDGIEGLVLGSGSPLGEAHAALQRMALSLKQRGIILCVSSKNDEAIALDAFRNHPEMILKEDDIVAFRVNWEDKAANIKAIADAIDLGLDSFVFLDDNPAERKRVRDALPAVAVPELPDDPSDWLTVFQAAGYFEQASFSREDQLRAGFYKANALRAAQMERIGNHDDYLRSLGMRLSIAPFDGAGPQADRAADLQVEPVQPDHPPLQRGRNRRAAVRSRRDHGAGPSRGHLRRQRHDLDGDLPAARPALRRRQLDHVLPRARPPRRGSDPPASGGAGPHARTHRNHRTLYSDRTQRVGPRSFCKAWLCPRQRGAERRNDVATPSR